MAARASWKGFLKLGELVCPVGLYAAASTSERISFHMLNRKTGNRLHRQFVDSDTGREVPREDQVKGYAVSADEHVMIEADEIASVMPISDKTLDLSDFVPCAEVDDLYFDRPYYLAPDGKAAETAFGVLRAGMMKANVAAIARAVLFRRVRTLLVRPQGAGMFAMTLNFDYEVRSAKEAFASLKAFKIKGEMLDLARHIIATKRGTFDPSAVDDRYDAALAELVKAKQEGRKLVAPKRKAPEKVVDLMDALRRSAAATPAKTAVKGAQKRTAAPRRKAG